MTASRSLAPRSGAPSSSPRSISTRRPTGTASATSSPKSPATGRCGRNRPDPRSGPSPPGAIAMSPTRARLPLLALFALALLAPASGPFCASRLAAEEPAQAGVALTIDYGDGSQKRIVDLAWRDGLTVFEALQLASKRRCGV